MDFRGTHLIFEFWSCANLSGAKRHRPFLTCSQQRGSDPERASRKYLTFYEPTLGQTSAGNIQFGLGGISRPYCSFAYSSLASLRTGMSGSASFQSSRNSK